MPEKNEVNEPEFLLLYEPKANEYILIKTESNLRVYLDNDLTPMDPEFYEVVLKPAMERIRFEDERKGKK